VWFFASGKANGSTCRRRRRRQKLAVKEDGSAATALYRQMGAHGGDGRELSAGRRLKRAVESCVWTCTPLRILRHVVTLDGQVNGPGTTGRVRPVFRLEVGRFDR